MPLSPVVQSSSTVQCLYLPLVELHLPNYLTYIHQLEASSLSLFQELVFTNIAFFQAPSLSGTICQLHQLKLKLLTLFKLKKSGELPIYLFNNFWVLQSNYGINLQHFSSSTRCCDRNIYLLNLKDPY